MTIDEAIELLNESKDEDVQMTIREWKEWDARFFEAVDMAVDVLIGALTAVIAGLKQLPVAQPELWEVDNMVIDCNKCIWATRDGNCVTWDCKFVDKQEAYDAWLKRRL